MRSREERTKEKRGEGDGRKGGEDKREEMERGGKEVEGEEGVRKGRHKKKGEA